MAIVNIHGEHGVIESYDDGRPDDPTEVASRTIEDRLRQALATNKAYLALDTPTAAQQRAQLARLTRQNTALIRHLLRDLTDTSDT